ncbi:MAG: cache domain-containing protein [Candidatus Omnitrophica bacterium]|nr:cache domain-containing protein [Candidatus Omnitrophota bacterium]
MRKIRLAICISLVSCFLFFIGAGSAQEPKYQEKKQLVRNLVDEAAELIKTKGQTGLDAVADKKGKFSAGDTYVFVTSGETGADLVNPAFEYVEGLPAENYRNPDAKAAQMAIVNAVKDKDTAWIEYLWPKPNETKFSKKIAYLRKITINNKVRIVGAGFYPE